MSAAPKVPPGGSFRPYDDRRHHRPGPIRIALRTAHDVRHLRVCVGCNDIGDNRAMVGTPPMHGRCYIKRNGLQQLLWLPDEKLDRLTLNDIGPAAMRAILDRRA